MSRLSVRAEARLGGFHLDIAFESAAPVTALVGPSGAGKSLTLRAIAGLLRPVRGRITLDDRVLLDDAAGVDLPARRRDITLVPQGYAVFPHLTVAENMAFGLHAWPAEEAAQRVRVLADAVELTGRLEAMPSTLSGGQLQRVSLARAIAPRPKLILADEPLSAVDRPLRQRLREVLASVVRTEGVRLLFVTHDDEDAQALADQVLTVEAGRCVFSHDG